MALVIDATIGGANSNSYVSLAEAETYFSGRLNADAWNNAATDDIKNRALAMATQRIDFESFIGSRVTSTQALKWPRTDLPYFDGVTYSSAEIPTDIKKATYELALYMLSKDMSAADGNDAYDSIKVGPINIDFADSQPSNNKLPPFVMRLLDQFKEYSLGIISVSRG